MALPHDPTRRLLEQAPGESLDLTVVDQVEVRLNGTTIDCINSHQPGGEAPPFKHLWQIYDIKDTLPHEGINEIALRATKQNDRVRKEIPLEVTDIELEIDYDYPNGPWCEPFEFTAGAHERSDTG